VRWIVTGSVESISILISVLTVFVSWITAPEPFDL